MILAFAAGASYAGLLWLIAAVEAGRRSIRLGGTPYATIALCGCVAALAQHVLPSHGLALIVASLVGAIVCATVDVRTGLIFDVLSASMAGVACALAFYNGQLVSGVVAASWIGAGMLALYVLTARRGIGLGDVKLATALALGYGLQLSIVSLGSAFIVGAGYAGALLGSGRAKRSDAIRFGPFIAIGAAAGLTANVLGYRW